MKAKKLTGIVVALMLMLGVGVVGAQSDSPESTSIMLADDSTTIDGDGAEVVGNTVTIRSSGIYNLSGALSEGQIIVNTQDAGAVSLNLNGIMLSSTNVAPLYIQNAASVALVLAENSQNGFTSSATYESTDELPNAAIVSSANLTIEGSGSLTVVATSNDGVTAPALIVNGSPIISVTAADDAIDVATSFTITGGELSLSAGGGINGNLGDLSGKGIKAKESIVIEGGSISIDAADDGIRSEKDLIMNDGTLNISVVGKAVHASYNLEINGGSITVLNSDEGIEGGFIIINDGNINISSTDDGINVSEPDDIPAALLYYLHINGGYIVVNAEGDGLDSNGSIEINGGVTIVNGPTAMNNGALDYDGTFNMNGGVLIAAGSAGMPAAPGQTSSQPSVMINFDSALEAGTLVHIQSAEGEQLLTFAPDKTYQSVVFSSPALVANGAYTVYSAGSSDGTAVEGLYSDGNYTPGIEQASFTVSSVVTQIGEVIRRGGRP